MICDSMSISGTVSRELTVGLSRAKLLQDDE